MNAGVEVLGVGKKPRSRFFILGMMGFFGLEWDSFFTLVLFILYVWCFLSMTKFPSTKMLLYGWGAGGGSKVGGNGLGPEVGGWRVLILVLFFLLLSNLLNLRLNSERGKSM